MLRAIIGVNLAVFALMVGVTGTFSWSARTLLYWGGNFGELTLSGQPWRLLTAQYLHANLIHIFGNMLLLFYAGRYVESLVGPARFVLCYSAAGIAAGLLSAWAHPDVVGVGASGAIAGVIGMLIAFHYTGRAPEVSGAWVWQTVALNALLSLAPGVDWVAHIGGLLTGIGCAVLLFASVPSARARLPRPPAAESRDEGGPTLP